MLPTFWMFVNFLDVAKRINGGAEENGKPTARKLIFGAPTPPDWKCREGLRQLVQLIDPFDQVSDAFFTIGFLPILDEILSQLISWTEGAASEQLRERAGKALAERVRFLATQEQQWSESNSGFAAMNRDFGDKRGARAPLNYIGWLVSDYVRVIDYDRQIVAVYLVPDCVETGKSVADVLGYSPERKRLFAKLTALPALSTVTAPKWAQIVYERMKIDAPQIMNAPEMRGRDSYRGRKRKEERLAADATARFSDFKETIVDAVRTLARKPRGSVRGVTRP